MKIGKRNYRPFIQFFCDFLISKEIYYIFIIKFIQDKLSFVHGLKGVGQKLKCFLSHGQKFCFRQKNFYRIDGQGLLTFIGLHIKFTNVGSWFLDLCYGFIAPEKDKKMRKLKILNNSKYSTKMKMISLVSSKMTFSE